MGADRPVGARPLPDADDASAEATVLRMLLGARLRRLRESAGIPVEKAGYEIRSSRSKISRMETGRVGFKLRDVEDLLTLYGVTDTQQHSEVLALARRSSAPDWWAKYSDILPDWFESYLGLESAASAIRSFEVQFVPGLFQTEDYARAVTRLGHQGESPEEIERRVDLRIKRQELLTRQGPPRLWAVMDEAVLRRPYGGAAVMRAQLSRLVEAAEMPHVTLQVVPFARGGHAGASGAFSILRFAERDLPDVVFIEQLTSALYLDLRPDVEHYLEVVDQISAEALSPAETIGFIEQAARETQPVPPHHPQTRNQSPGNEQRKTVVFTAGGSFFPAAPGEIGALLDEVTLADLWQSADALDGSAGLEAKYALGWLYWYRYLALPEGQDISALESCVALLAPCFVAGQAELPEPLLPALAERAVPAAVKLLEQALNSIDTALLSESVSLWGRIVGASPSGNAHAAMWLSNLEVALRVRFERTGDVADLESAIDAGREAVAALPAGHPDQAAAMSDLGGTLLTRYLSTGSIADLNPAVDAAKTAADSVPAGNSERAKYLSNLGRALAVRFQHTSDVADLESAIDAGREAVAALPAEHPDRPAAMFNLQAALAVRHAGTGS
jgi:transcriptional regulator with XRE-family HTH domain